MGVRGGVVSVADGAGVGTALAAAPRPPAKIDAIRGSELKNPFPHNKLQMVWEKRPHLLVQLQPQRAMCVTRNGEVRSCRDDVVSSFREGR